MKITFTTPAITLTALLLSSLAEARDDITADQLFDLSLEELGNLVLGSHIHGTALTNTLPVTVLTKEDIRVTGALNGEQLLRAIPNMGAIGFGDARGSITGVNAARGDVSSLNLRSLGEGNTLALLNGRRMVLHPITQISSLDGVPVVTANANTIPVESLHKLEILRDGAGAVYGSDAVAGVVNYELLKDFEGSRLSAKAGAENDTDRDNINLNGSKGFRFNNNKSQFSINAFYSGKNAAQASEKDFSSNQDLRPLAPDFASDNSLDQRSSLEVFPLVNYTGLGQFHLRPADLLRDNGQSWSTADCGGLGLPGTATIINDGLQDLCLDADGQDRAIRPNRNEVRTLTPDVESYNIFSFFSHELGSSHKGSSHELYGEASYYSSTSKRQWEQASILSNGRFFVPADYYYNPFGPVTFDDGRTNPNRLAGLDTSIVPVEGLGFELLSLRPVDVGTRNVEINSSSYRLLAGLQGTLSSQHQGNWNYDTAVLYSEAEVTDKSTNRISTPLLQAQLSLDTPDAYNIFSGVNPSNPASINDQTLNARSSIDPFITSASRKATTSLTLADFKLSNGNWIELPAGNLALGLGAEWRRETLNENNSSNFDGSQPYIDPLDSSLTSGEITNPSQLQGSSVRPDVDASRKVSSAYAELIIPLVKDLPAIHSLDMQAAIRYEDFSDLDAVTRPKLALSWYPINGVQFRGAYSQGFRAPNLMQLNSPTTSLTTAVDDFAEGIALGTGDINNGPANGNYVQTSSGNMLLKPEKSDNASLGIVFSLVDNLVISADWWQIKTSDTVGIFSDENESRLDAVLRQQGAFNPNVVRAAPDANNPLGEILSINRQYENLNSRTVEGLDMSLSYLVDSSAGSFDMSLNTAQLLKFMQTPGDKAQLLVDSGANESVLDTSIGSQIENEFIPEWRGSAAINWLHPNEHWGAAFFVNYIGKVYEPTVSVNNRNLQVDDQILVNISGLHRGLLGKDSEIVLGINNLFDQDPPLASEALGYEGELHSSFGRFFYLGLSKAFK